MKGNLDLSPSPTLLERLYRTMLRIREFEEQVADLVEKGEIKCPCHLCIGQEATAAGVCASLETRDYLLGAHRSHGHYLAKGGPMDQMMAELFGRTTGCSRGRGGSMHLIAPEVGILGTVPIVSGTIPIAVGAALASSLRKDGRVTVVFFGDGAMEEGTLHESMNLAAVKKLPVVFVCENNFYSSHLHWTERRAEDNLLDSAKAHGMPGLSVDGNDVEAVHVAAQGAVERARHGGGPAFLECRTFRWRGHVGPSWDMDVGLTRKDEVQDWMKKDPIRRLKHRLVEAEGMKEEKFKSIHDQVKDEVARSVDFARRSPWPDPSDLAKFVYAERISSGASA